MKSHTLSALLLSAFSTVALQADWTVVSTFDDSSALDLITDATNIEGSNARSEIVDGKWAVYPGDLFETTSNLYAMLDMGTDLKAASMASGQPVTVYMEIVQPMVPDGSGGTRKAILDTVWGVANIDPSVVLETRYNSHNAMQRINGGTDGFEGRNGGTYEAVDLFTADVTYKIWLVIDFNLNFYETYIQGGQWTEQTRINTADQSGIWLFRVNPAPENIVQYFLVALSRGNSVAGEKGIDPTYFDNISYDATGQNLTTPPVGGGGETWAGFPVLPSGDVNTGDWMGWVNVVSKPWVLSYSLDQWMYIEESAVSSSGGWVYIFNF